MSITNWVRGEGMPPSESVTPALMLRMPPPPALPDSDGAAVTFSAAMAAAGAARTARAATDPRQQAILRTNDSFAKWTNGVDSKGRRRTVAVCGRRFLLSIVVTHNASLSCGIRPASVAQRVSARPNQARTGPGDHAAE